VEDKPQVRHQQGTGQSPECHRVPRSVRHRSAALTLASVYHSAAKTYTTVTRCETTHTDHEYTKPTETATTGLLQLRFNVPLNTEIGHIGYILTSQSHTLVLGKLNLT